LIKEMEIDMRTFEELVAEVEVEETLARWEREEREERWANVAGHQRLLARLRRWAFVLLAMATAYLGSTALYDLAELATGGAR
jgi:hypothetical protein